MSTEVHNASALVSFYRNKGVSLVKTPQGMLFFGTRFLKASERETLSKFDQKTLHAVWRRQR